jgi:hypothetical protein
MPTPVALSSVCDVVVVALSLVIPPFAVAPPPVVPPPVDVAPPPIEAPPFNTALVAAPDAMSLLVEPEEVIWLFVVPSLVELELSAMTGKPGRPTGLSFALAEKFELMTLAPDLAVLLVASDEVPLLTRTITSPN